MDLADHPLFKELSPADKDSLLQKARIHRVPAEVIIFDEDAPCDGLYLILNGTIAISKRQVSDGRRFVNYAKEGASFGELGVLLGRPRSARATSLSECTYAVIPAEVVQTMIAAAHPLLQAMIRVVSSHLSATTQNYLTDIGHQENLAMLGTLVNSVLHDFKNPLTLVALNSQILAQQHADARTQALCRNIEAQVERMSGMAAEIGEFSRSGKKGFFSKVNLKELVETFQFLNAPLFAEGRPGLAVSVESVEFEADPKKMLRAMQNIVGNAVDALKDVPDGKIKITGGAFPDGESIILEISDNGPGIPVAVQKRFWEPFFTHGKSGGTGLGSAIAKAMIDAHGGTITFQSSPEAGTTFRIVLPVKQSGPQEGVGRHLLNALVASQGK